MLGNQVMYQKFFSARTERDARVSVVGWTLGTLLLETLIVAIAVFGRALYPDGRGGRCSRARSFPTRRGTGCPR